MYSNLEMKCAAASELFIVLFVSVTLLCCVHLATHHSLTSGNAEEFLETIGNF